MRNNNGLSYRVYGNGNPVLLLHGFLEDAAMWDAFVSMNHTKTVLIDLNGHGQSKLDSDLNRSIKNMALQVMEIVAENNWLNAQIVGHSMGGYVGLELMKLNPQFEHLTLLNSHPWDDSDEKKRDRNRVIQLVQLKPKLFISEAIPSLFANQERFQSTIESYIEKAQQMDPAAITWVTAAMRDRTDNSNLLIENPEKFTVIQGEKDSLIPAKKMADFCTQHQISYIEVPNCGHMIHEENADALKEMLELILQ
jgi:pimeloyl-ACP methyl ester carboxylesterase